VYVLRISLGTEPPACTQRIPASLYGVQVYAWPACGLT